MQDGHLAQESPGQNPASPEPTGRSLQDESQSGPLSLIAPKLSIPRARPNCVVRSRLIERLDQGRERKLTLISAPAGFGKTTLIISWLQGLANLNRDAPRIAWLSLEEEDNDPVRFLAYFVAAMQIIDSGVGQIAGALLKMPRVPDLNHVMTMIINDLVRLQGRSVLVLDDYHLINHSGLQAAVGFFLDHLPPPCHLVIMTREEPQLPLPRWRVQGAVMEIHLQDLRFNEEETALFLNQTMGLTLTTEAVRTLEDRTEGWAAGLQMAALSLPGRLQTSESTDLFLKIDRHCYIIDYLAAEVLQQQPAEVRTFLRQTAILDRFNASLCDALTGRNDSQALLLQLERANLFLIPLDEKRQWYRYHHLFAAFLRSELTGPERLALHRTASQWFEDRDLASEAIKHALAAQDPLAAVRLIRHHAEKTLCHGGFATILGWVKALPEEILQTQRDMLVLKGWTLYRQGERTAAETYATLAIESRRAEDPPIWLALLLGFRSYLAINRSKPTEAMKYAQEALEILGETDSFYRIMALSYLGQAQRLTGNRHAAIQTLRQAMTVGQRLNNHLTVLEAMAFLTILLYQQGQLREALKLCEQTARHYLNEHGPLMPVAGVAYISLGILYYEINDLDRAHYHLTVGVTLCRQMEIGHSALLGQCMLAKLYYAWEEHEAMSGSLNAARQLATGFENRRRLRLVSVTTAELQLRQGQAAAAERSLADLPATAAERSVQENLVFVRLWLAREKLPAAQSLLQQMEQVALRQDRRGTLITIYLLQTLAHQALNRHAAAGDYLERAIHLAAPEGYSRIFLDENTAIAALLRQRQKVAPAFIAGLLESSSSGRTAQTAGTGGEMVPLSAPPADPLSKVQLMILRLVADGLSNREIAARLQITEGTTKWHLNRIFGNLNVSNRTQAVARARQLKLI